MIAKVFALIALVVAAFAGYVALQPGDYRVARSAVMAAPPEAVYDQIQSFRKWDAWSPWAKKDPKAKATFSGPESGKGAAFSWSGNAEVGEGTMTIVDAKPGQGLRIKLDFVKPMVDTADVAFDLKPEAGGTRVTWAMSGHQGFVGRAICTLMRVNLDTMVGGEYEKGLASLKSIVEAKKG